MTDFSDAKNEPYLSLNPNGQLPALEDPNTGIKIFESGAIFEYLIDTYDATKKLQYETPKEKYLTKSWLHFQMSGQGPYFGMWILLHDFGHILIVFFVAQLFWYLFIHPERNLTSVIDRYREEVKRVWGVIDRHLKMHGTDYLVGDQVTYADLAWVTWDVRMIEIQGELIKPEEKFSAFFAWHQRLTARPSVQTMIISRKNAMKSSNFTSPISKQ
jgi:glutathione S-transferase